MYTYVGGGASDTLGPLTEQRRRGGRESKNKKYTHRCIYNTERQRVDIHKHSLFLHAWPISPFISPPCLSLCLSCSSRERHRGRDCVYPEVPRTYHNGVKGTFMDTDTHNRYVGAMFICSIAAGRQSRHTLPFGG